MYGAEVQLGHALNSVSLLKDIRTALTETPDNPAVWCKEVDSLTNRIYEILKHTPAAHAPAEWRVMGAGLPVLASHVACLTIAKGCEGDLVAERTRHDVLAGELRRLLSSNSIPLPDSAESIRNTLLQAGQYDYDRLRAFLLSIPLPTLYWHSKELIVHGRDSAEKPDKALSPLLRVIVFLDHDPISSPQLLKSNILYPLMFRIRGLVWPSNAVRLRLDLLSTCPRNEFSVSEFAMERPRSFEDDEYQGELGGQIKFNSGQSSLLDDLVFTIRGAFETNNGPFMEVPVIGHTELRLRVVNEDRHPLMTGNRRLDRHIEELIITLLSDCPKVRDELPDLLNILQALTRLLTTYAQEAIYKGRSDVLEPEFQARVLRDLRFVLGQDVQEHPSQAGGITDIRYRGVIVELKVETENGDRKHISKKYTAQTVQYAGVEARQVSILLVLDLTSKDKPPGDIRDDIILTDVETHGGDSEAKKFPSKAFVFVINGNVKSPSTYSR